MFTKSSLLILTFFLTTRIILALSPFSHTRHPVRIHPRSSNSTTDPCDTDLTCGPILSAFQTCTNSTDITCGCDAWINFSGDCAACGVLNRGQTSFTLPTETAMIRGFCECPVACANASAALFIAGPFSETAASQFCGVDFVVCADCVRGKDVFIAQAITGYFAQLCSEA